jgi:hypothetical protein
MMHVKLIDGVLGKRNNIMVKLEEVFMYRENSNYKVYEPGKWLVVYMCVGGIDYASFDNSRNR